jgi:hypothetical protein
VEREKTNIMNIDLPVWNDKITISKEIYDNIRKQANQGLIRACKIYDGYCKTQDAILYEIFTREITKIQTNLNIIAKENPVWAKEESEKLLDLGMNMLLYDNLSEYQVTMIMDLGSAINGN